MTDEFVLELIKKYRVPKHIQKHMQKVAEVCMFIGEKIIARAPKQATSAPKAALKIQPPKLNLKILKQAALLHDFMKLCDFAELNLQHFEQTYTADDIQFWSALIKSCNKKRHIQAAYEILKDLGEDEIATIILKHRFNCLIDPDPKNRPITLEEKILYYADKRVMHDKIVSLAERLDDGHKRWTRAKLVSRPVMSKANDLQSKNQHEDALVEKALYKLEKELLDLAKLKPEDINEVAIK